MGGGDDEISDQESGYFRGWSKGFPQKVRSRDLRNSAEYSPKHRPWSRHSRTPSPSEQQNHQRPRLRGRGTSRTDSQRSLLSSSFWSRKPSSRNNDLAYNAEHNSSTSSKAVDSDISLPEEAVRYITQANNAKGANHVPLKRDSSESKLETSSISRGSLRSKASSLIRKSLIKPVSEASRSVELLGAPPQEASTAESCVEPTEDDTKTHQWRTGLPGHWIEIRIGQRARMERAGTKPSGSHESAALGEKENAAYAARDEARPETIQQLMSNPEHDRTMTTVDTQGMVDADSQEPVPKERFFDKVRRQFASKVKTRGNGAPRGFVPVQNTSATSSLLNHATSLLRKDMHVKRQACSPESESLSTSSWSISSYRRRRPPLIQRSSDKSTATSRTSLNMMPPNTTPDPELEYTSADNQRYMRVEISRSDAPKFLPSEATKVGAPPGTPRPGRLTHGFFLDQQYPPTAEPSAPWTTEHTRPKPSVDPILGVERDWFRVEANEAEMSLAGGFDLDVPEHLPNSPLCPRNPRNAANGKGICVYHGRNKSATDDLLGIPETPGLYNV